MKERCLIRERNEKVVEYADIAHLSLEIAYLIKAGIYGSTNRRMNTEPIWRRYNASVDALGQRPTCHCEQCQCDEIMDKLEG